MIVLERPDGIRIVRVKTVEEAQRYRASFAGAYQDIFSEPPYNERFFPSEAQGILNRYLQTPENVCLLAIRGRSKVVGFGIGVPAHSKPDIARDLRGLLPVNHTYYLAELGVLESPAVRARKAARGHAARADRHKVFTHGRCKVKNQSYDMYMDMGFDDIGVYTEVILDAPMGASAPTDGCSCRGY